MGKFKDSVIKELGETTDAYEWRQLRSSEQMYQYQFYAGEIEYEVIIEVFMPGYLSAEFAPDSSQNLDKMPGETRYSMTTGAGSPFRIMATVLQIAKHAWETREDFRWSSDLKGFAFDPSRKKTNQDGPNVRRKLYKRFIQKQFPGAKIESGPGDLVLTTVKE